MKKSSLSLLALLVTFASFSMAWATATPTQIRFQKVYEATKDVNECRGTVSSPVVFGEKGKEISIMTFAKLGSITVGNESKAFKLSVDKGSLETIIKGQRKNYTYRIDPKVFLTQLKAMHDFVNQALVIAQKDGKNEFIKQVTCASKIIEITQAEHQVQTNLVQK